AGITRADRVRLTGAALKTARANRGDQIWTPHAEALGPSRLAGRRLHGGFTSCHRRPGGGTQRLRRSERTLHEREARPRKGSRSGLRCRYTVAPKASRFSSGVSDEEA